MEETLNKFHLREKLEQIWNLDETSFSKDPILSAYHDNPLAGHYGPDKTYRRISTRYYWTRMRKYIESYTKNCLECQCYKSSNQKPAGLLQTTVMNQRLVIISFDLFGPLPTSLDGKTWIFIVEDVPTR